MASALVLLYSDGTSPRARMEDEKNRTLTVVLGGACFSLLASLLVKPLGLGGEVDAAAEVRAIAERSTSDRSESKLRCVEYVR